MKTFAISLKRNAALLFKNRKLNLFLLFSAYFFIGVLFTRLMKSTGVGYSVDDNLRYNHLSNQILAGNFNLNIGIFIVAPLYPYLEAFVKLLTGNHWIIGMIFVQIILFSLSGIYLYLIAELLFEEYSRRIPLLSAFIYLIFPMTMWFVGTFSQEMLFQSLFIITIYYLLKALKEQNLKSLITSAFLYLLTFLTKSHILLFSPFIVLIIFISMNTTKIRKLVYSLMFGGICLLFTLPYGLYNLRVNGVYTFSTNGADFFFYTGNNESTYKFLVATPSINSSEYKWLASMSWIPSDAVKDRKLYIIKALQWIKDNPRKFIELKKVDLFQFLTPGVSYKHYPFNKWLQSFIVSLPIYLFGYLGIIIALTKDFRKHVWILSLFLTMIIFSVGFYVQNRFRTITIEPFYIVYSAFGIWYFLKQIPLGKILQH
ncbi:MAG: glycosyltransferase family 39 protein [Deltaproteobacteria bacterium]|nr:glycosyltransferase family 39 protein [Deltaproteobacteria bacterium]MCL5791430.1 glycosyltransferase family 39 protein [Deltaproteobacteria bacterium]